MKKGLIIGLAASLVVALGVTFAFAESPKTGMTDKTQMYEIHKKMVDQHVKDGTLTPEQAKVMDDHMASMGSMMNSNTVCHPGDQSTTAIPQQ